MIETITTRHNPLVDPTRSTAIVEVFWSGRRVVRAG